MRWPFRLAAALTIALSASFFAPALNAAASEQDNLTSRMSKFIANRYELYDDARAHAETIQDSDLRTITTAEIYLLEADRVNGSRGAEARSKGVAMLDALESIAGKLAYAVAELDDIQKSGFKASDKPRLTRVLTKVAESKTMTDDQIALNPAKWADDMVLFRQRMSVFLQEARVHYIQASGEMRGSPARIEQVQKCLEVLDSLKWERAGEPNWAPANFDGYILAGDVCRLNDEAKEAVRHYLSLFEELSVLNLNHPDVIYNSLRAVIKAVETYMIDMGGGEAEAMAAKEEINKALALFPRAVDSEQGKQLRMFAISIDIANEPNIDKPLEDLLKLASEPSSGSFKVTAAKELARVSTLDRLSHFQRFRCVKAIAAVNFPTTNMMTAHAIHGLLARLDTPQLFEAYAPYCYGQLGLIYESLGRYQEAARVLREGADRLHYMRKDGWEGSEAALPGHFFGADKKPICDIPMTDTPWRLSTQGEAYEFPKLLGERALLNVRFLVSKSYGDRNNRDFMKLHDDINRWFSRYLGSEALYNAVRGDAVKAYNEGKNNAQRSMDAAQLMLSTPARHDLAAGDAFYAGSAAIRVANTERGGMNGSLAWDDFFLKGYKLTGNGYKDLPFDSQMQRADDDFSFLPESVRNDLKAHINRLAGPNALRDSREFPWELALYSFKRSIMLSMNLPTYAISERGVDVEGKSLSQLVDLHTAFLNASMSERSNANSAMLDMAETVSLLIQSLRQPYSGLPDRNAQLERVAALQSERLPELKAWLEVVWKAFGPQLRAELRNGDADSRKRALELMTRIISDRFYAYATMESDPNGAAEAIATFEAFREVYENDMNEAEKAAAKDTMTSMLRNLRGLMTRTQKPLVDGLFVGASAIIDGYSNLLAKPTDMLLLVENTHEAELASLKGDALTKRRADLMKDFLLTRLFNADAKSGTVEIGAVMPTGEREAFIAQFDNLYATCLKELEADLKKSLAKLIAHPDLKNIQAGLAECQSTLNNNGFNAYIDMLNERAAAGGDDGRAYARVKDDASFSLIMLAPVTGNAFREGLSDYLQERAVTFRKIAGDAAQRWMAARDMYAEFSGEERFPEAANRAFADIFRLIGMQRSSEQAWQNSYDLWQREFKRNEERFGDVAFIAVRADEKKLQDAEGIAEEIELRFETANAAIQLYRLNPTAHAELKKDALHHLQRVMNILRWRDSIVQRKDTPNIWLTNFNNGPARKAVERFYVPTYLLYAEVLRAYAKRKDTPEWEKQYLDQSGKRLTREEVIEHGKTKPDQQYVALPKTERELLQRSAELLITLYAGYQEETSVFNATFRTIFSELSATYFELTTLLSALPEDQRKPFSDDDYSGGLMQQCISLRNNYGRFMFRERDVEFMNEVIRVEIKAFDETASGWREKRGITEKPTLPFKRN